ncbi:hypothetical protein E8M24_07380 [Bacillus thuringiensis]|uniref:hypothetical protein n=1 Tax=Bacillus thuringiensis TaxID=1428 RepID=UPI00125ED566|nr:hypothetical protein [Bacillus thuringiensis]KAB5655976.1 hypothetical protein E8M24_07380 [Bacillus thuringiensis]HDR5267527.1 hypothetical protein [Bacillus thuringiensis]
MNDIYLLIILLGVLGTIITFLGLTFSFFIKRIKLLKNRFVIGLIVSIMSVIIGFFNFEVTEEKTKKTAVENKIKEEQNIQENDVNSPITPAIEDAKQSTIEEANDKTSVQQNASPQTESTHPTEPTNNSIYKKYEIESKVESTLTDVLTDMKYVTVKESKINEHLGTDNPDDYILLLYLSFDGKNSGQQTKSLIDMYNNEIGARIGGGIDKIQELVIFWEVPHIKKGPNLVKVNLQRLDDKMVFKEKWIDPILK